MSDVKIFVLGATGFLGASAFDLIYAKHPEYHYALLIRSEETATELKMRYPLIRAVFGDMSNTDLLEYESEKARIVISAVPKTRI